MLTVKWWIEELVHYPYKPVSSIGTEALRVAMVGKGTPLLTSNFKILVSEPHTSVTTLHAHVCVYVCRFGPTT